MTIISQLVQKDLINLEGKGETKQELLKNLAETLFKKGYVNDGFAKAILEREEEFPTGLQLEKAAVAIPHTYSEYVKRPFIYVVKLANPVTFIQMGTSDVEVDVHFVVVLGISEPKNQTGLLVELMNVFQQEAFIEALQNSQTEEEIYNLFATAKMEEE